MQLQRSEIYKLKTLKLSTKVNISNDGDNWTIGYKVAHRVMMMTFTIGEEFEDMKPFFEEVSKVEFIFRSQFGHDCGCILFREWGYGNK